MNSNIEMAADAVPLSELVRRGELLSADCPSREVLKHVTSRWGVLVLMVLLDEQMCRFSDLRRKVDGVSEKMLAQTLQWLAADGFVVRTSYDVVPPHVDYRLTPLGKEVARQVSSLADWIEINLARIMGARASSQGAGESI
ncbi:HxlR family transcriptional regulator [Burkholderia sp. PAMC 28687]|uniref:winged helix-turn-helix transcriptional regulator n=1 Tax=Burkholderia sp. PAMC 28687 TaxID=1795874 RepID=UPI00078322A0|nr:helix-turn-helix domain-containing protein [Burkholderia sp. PAMC 28687]AMM15900.1 HxlR family transcriptional regulator [Burkholderia sp. PAMC 28687]